MSADLKRWRDQHGVTQKQLASLLSDGRNQLSVLTVSAWERGAHAIPVYLGLALAEVSRRLSEGEVELDTQTSRQSGEAHHDAKLTEADVRKIRKQFKDGVSINQIARERSVNAGTISKIARGLTWKDVK